MRHDQDLCGHLFRGGGGSQFVWLNIPGIIYQDTGSEEWYQRAIEKHGYTHAIPYIYNLNRSDEESSFWEARKSLESLKQLQEADPYNFNAQYMGSPTAKGTGIIRDEWWGSYDRATFDYNEITRTFIVADTASTTKSYSDYSVLMHVGVTFDNKLIVLDMDIGKFETPVLKERMKEFWRKHNVFDPNYPRMLPWNFYCEDRSSGHYLIQHIAAEGGFQLTPVPRDKTHGDKVARFLNTVPYFSQGRILFPTEHEHLGHAKREILSYTNLGSGSGHDDVVDVIADAVAIAFGATTLMDYGSWL